MNPVNSAERKPLLVNLSLPAANYDEQLGLTLSQNITGLSYNVTAVQQSDSYGYGPSYLLNGLSDKGFWYQVGFSWDWPFSQGGYSPGFNFNYEVSNSTGQSVFPTTGGGGLVAYSGTVNQGDSVLLSLYFSGGVVFMYSLDWNTSATAIQDFSGQGASTFLGLKNSTTSHGFFTGPMTEMYRVSPYYGQESKVSFTNPRASLTGGIMWIDEWDNGTSLPLFAQASHALNFSKPGQLQFFSSNGATIGSDTFQFITGAIGIFGITMSYTVQAGGSGYSAPTMSYYSNGTKYVTTLGTQATTYYMDNRSSWSVSAQLPGSTPVERWATTRSTGNATSSKTIVIVYDHQFMMTIAATPAGEGTVQPSGSNWFEAGSQVSIQAQGNAPFIFTEWRELNSSISFENYKASSTVAAVSGPGTIDAVFGQIALSLGESSGNITEGASASLAASLVGTAGATELSVSGLPSGVTARFGTNPVIPDSSGVTTPLTIATSFSTPSGTYALTIFANSSEGNDFANYTLNVREAVALTFEATGGNGVSLPRLNFTYNGAVSATNLSSAADTVYVDYGSTWRVDSVLAGSNSTERWVASTGNTNGTARTSQTVSLEYFHQYAEILSFAANDGSTPSSLPVINFTFAGTPTVQSLNKTRSTVWMDAATSYSYTSMINHNASERWIIVSGNSGKISRSTSISAYYYHQFLVSVTFTVSGGGASYSAPIFNFKTLGAILNETMQLQPVAYWLDANSTWTAPKLLIGSSTSERWTLVNSTGTGRGNASSSILMHYLHQFFLRLSPNYRPAGSITPGTGWYNANATVKLAEKADSGWKFIRWDGNANLSSGAITVDAPLNETAVFYAEVVISSPSNGDITYSYGSVQGTVTAGSATTIFVPPGTSLVFKAVPSSMLYTINSWKTGNNSAPSSSSYSMVVSGPGTISLAMDFNYAIVGIIGAVVGAGVVGAVFLFLKKRGPVTAKVSEVVESGKELFDE